MPSATKSNDAEPFASEVRSRVGETCATGETTTVATTPSTSQLPYTRYVLSTKAEQENKRNLPTGFENVISMSDWNDFWSRIQPIALAAERFKYIIAVASLFLYFGFVFLIVAVSDELFILFSERWFFLALMVVSFGMSLIVGYFLHNWMGAVRYSHLQQLSAECKRAEEVYGWTDINSSKAALECDFEIVGNCFCLYITPAPAAFSDYASVIQSNQHGHGILPMQTSEDDHSSGDFVARNGSLRIQLLNSKGGFSGWTPISLSKLTKYSTLSYRVTFLEDHAMWKGFWSELFANSKDYLFAYRQLIMGQCLMPLFLLGVTSFKFDEGANFDEYTDFDRSIRHAQIAFGLELLVYAFLMYTIVKFVRCASIQRETIKRYALHNFALTSNGGCTMEHRQIYGFRQSTQGGVSMFGAHYLYVFPLTTSQLVADGNVSMPGEII